MMGVRRQTGIGQLDAPAVEKRTVRPDRDQHRGVGVLRDTDCRCPAAHDIQFTPASLFHFVVIFFDFVQKSIEPGPVMSPTPNFDSFQPPKPKGSRGTGTPTFTPTIPALAFSIT